LGRLLSTLRAKSSKCRRNIDEVCCGSATAAGLQDAGAAEVTEPEDDITMIQICQPGTESPPGTPEDSINLTPLQVEDDRDNDIAVSHLMFIVNNTFIAIYMSLYYKKYLHAAVGSTSSHREMCE